MNKFLLLKIFVLIFGYLIHRMHLRRSFPGIFLQYILPSILLIIIVFSTNYHFQQRFEAVLTVNVTCLLTISFFFVDVFLHLPETPEIKIIDLLLIKCITLACTNILCQTLYMRRQVKMKKCLKIMLMFYIPFLELTTDFFFIITGILYDCQKISLV